MAHTTDRPAAGPVQRRNELRISQISHQVAEFHSLD